MSGPGNRAQWASNLGFLLAAAGSAVGLGNIWKFPGKAYEGGGGAFILIYIAIIALVGATVMLAEFIIGRATQKNAVGAFCQLRPAWKWVGGMGIFTGFIILCYYSHVGGWVLYYLCGYLTDAAAISADPTAYFYRMLGVGSGFPWGGAVLFPLLFAALTVFVVVKGVAGGIERLNKVAMPLLFLLLILLMVRAVTLPGAMDGLRYMLQPDFSLLTWNDVLVALGQAFFSLSLGMGIMCTYGSYLSREENLGRNVGIICTLDTLVAVLAGFTVIPAVFATLSASGVGKGAGFVFTAMPGVFQAMPGGVFWAILFYLLLFFAALTSSISLLEGTVAYLTEQRGFSRKRASLALGVILFGIGLIYTLSQGHADIHGIWLDKNGISYPIFGDMLEFLTDRLLLPLGGLLFCIFAGWVWGTKNGIAEVRQGGRFRFPLAGLWSLLVRFVAPAAIACILIAGVVFGVTLS